MEEGVQCSQPATNHWLVTPGNCAISGAQLHTSSLPSKWLISGMKTCRFFLHGIPSAEALFLQKLSTSFLPEVSSCGWPFHYIWCYDFNIFICLMPFSESLLEKELRVTHSSWNEMLLFHLLKILNKTWGHSSSVKVLARPVIESELGPPEPMTYLKIALKGRDGNKMTKGTSHICKLWVWLGVMLRQIWWKRNW